LFSQEQISIEKIWKYYNYYPKGVEGYNAMADGASYSVRQSDNSIVKRDFEDKNKKEIIFNPIDNFTYDGYEFNADETKILFLTEVESIYRYSYSANYYLFDRATEKIQPLDEKRQPQTLAEYSPDGNHVSYIYKNNIYTKNLKTGLVTELTSDGEKKRRNQWHHGLGI
jgi:dipeptidyl-peptidase-4